MAESPSPAPSPGEGGRLKARVQALVARGAAAMDAGDMAALAGLYDEARAFGDPQRVYQARRALAELALAFRPPDQRRWIAAFATSARGLIDALEEEPAEPQLLNLTGVLLYELAELRAAEALFGAALRLDAELVEARRNLDALRLRRRDGARLPGGAAAVHGLRDRAVAVARRARPAQGLRITLCMIVKDEEEMLPGCLEPLAGGVDEMVIVDTGSSDRTVEIAESFGARVVHFPWNGSFADARNVSLEHAQGDWVLTLDADEHLMPEDVPLLRELSGRTWREGFYLVETNYTGGEEAGGAAVHTTLRLWRHRPAYRWEGRIHEQRTNMPSYLPERFDTVPVRIRHYGYLTSRVTDRDKSRRNIELLEEEAREAPGPFVDFNLGSEYLALGEFDRARTLFDRALEALRPPGPWTSAGYLAPLITRTARVRHEQHDFAAMEDVVEEGLNAFPGLTDLVLERASAARTRGDLVEAERLARRCLEMGDAPAAHIATVGTGTFLALALLADVCETSGRADEAEELRRRSLAEYPDYVAPVAPLVAALARRGLPLEQIAAHVPARPSARLLAASGLYESGRVEEAEGWFRDVLQEQPSNAAARIGLGEALLSQRRYVEAADEARREPVTSPLASAAVGLELFGAAAAGDHARVREVLETRAREAHLAEGETALYAAWADALGGDGVAGQVAATAGPPALTALEALLRVRDVDAFATLVGVFGRIDGDPREKREALARVYLRRGFLEAAADEWIAVATEAPDADAMLGLAQVALARGHHDDAAAFAEEALALDPENVGAAQLLGAVRGALAQRS